MMTQRLYNLTWARGMDTRFAPTQQCRCFFCSWSRGGEGDSEEGGEKSTIKSLFSKIFLNMLFMQSEFEIKFSGKDVDSWTMGLEDIVPVLQWISSAFWKIANYKWLSQEHKVRVSWVKKWSFIIVLSQWIVQEFQNAPIQTTLAAWTILTGVIVWCIRLTKWLRWKQPTRTEFIDNSDDIRLYNSDNASITINRQTYEIYNQNIITSDLSLMVSPLQEWEIDNLEIKQDDISEDVSFSEKSYFSGVRVVTSQTQEMTISGKLNAMRKTSKTGQIILWNGNKLPFRIRDNEEKFYELFSYPSTVKIRCVANMDENLQPIDLEAYDIEKTQLQMSI